MKIIIIIEKMRKNNGGILTLQIVQREIREATASNCHCIVTVLIFPTVIFCRDWHKIGFPETENFNNRVIWDTLSEYELWFFLLIRNHQEVGNGWLWNIIIGYDHCLLVESFAHTLLTIQTLLWLVLRPQLKQTVTWNVSEGEGN